MSVAVLTALVPALAMLAGVVAAPAASAGTVPPPAGWTTLYSDNFSGPAGSGLDSSWTADQGTQYSGTGCTGAYGTGEVDTASASTANVSEDGNGDLDITPLDNNGMWTSGRIETVADDFAAPAGGEMEVTATIKQPNPASGDGYWPAFWMLGAGFRASGAGTSGTMDCSNWPSVGEIDVMEDVNGLSELSSTLHCDVDPGGPCDEPDGITSGLTTCSGCQTGYNTYSVIINRTDTSAESISWYLNNNPTPYLTVNEDQVPTATWQAAVDHGFFLILDVAMGGAFPNPVCGCSSPTSSTTSGASMSVSDVAVYTTSGGGGATAPAAPTGLTVTGTTSSSASLSWTAPSGTVSGYDVYENGSQAASGVTGTSDTITGLAASTAYSFAVVAYNSAGGSPQSGAVTATTSGSAGGGGGGTSCSTTATSDISADCYSSSQGSIDVTSTADPDPSGVDGSQVAQLTNGDYLEYPGVDFGSGSSQFTARVASGAASGVSGLVEVVLDNPDNAPVGTFAVGNTGGWSAWESIPADITTTTGTHNVYLEFVSGAGGNPPFVSLHYFNFPTT